MAATAIPFSASNATPADRLLDMLESVTTLRDWMVWCRDCNEHQHLLPPHDHRNLVRIATALRSKLCRERV